MRKPIKPFSVEMRRTGRKAVQPAQALPPESAEQDASSQPVVTSWPDPEDIPLSEARRAADALFSGLSATPQPAEPQRQSAADERRVLPSLVEEDHIARLLEEEEANRPRRGRRAASPDEPVPARHDVAAEGAPAPDMPKTPAQWPTWIPGYVRGQIFARYARRSEPSPGKNWRKRLKPAW